MADPAAPPPPPPPAGSVVPQAPQAPQQLAALQAPQQPAVPQAPQQAVPPQVPQQRVHLIWSNFKPEFSGKPDKDAEAHLLCTNNWMNAHHFVEEKPDCGTIHYSLLM